MQAPSPEQRPSGDWPAQAADSIERFVASIHDKTTAPLTKVARVLVFGVLAAIVGVAAAVLLAIGLVRAVDGYLPGEVWSAHLLTGGILAMAGLFLLAKAGKRRA